MGIDLRSFGACIRCATCDGFPCRVGAKSDAETVGIDPALETGKARLLSGVRVTRLVTEGSAGRVSHLEAQGANGPVTIIGERYVLAPGR